MSPRILAVAVMLGIVACSSGDDTRSPATDAATDSTMGLVVRGASVALAVRSMPEKTDSILTAADMTVASYEQLMYRIAADPVASDLFVSAVGR